MPTPSIASLGQTRGGIRSEADVLARCEVLSATGCWIWLGACSSGKAGANPIPVCYHADAGKVSSVRQVLRSMAGLPKVPRVWSSCGDIRCVCPGHAIAGSHAEYGAWVANSDAWKRHPKKIAASRRNSRRYHLTDDQVRAVRIMTPAEAMQAFGLSYSAAWKIRRREAWTHVPDKAPSFGAARHAVDVLPQGYRSQISASECRPWAVAAVQGRAAA